MGLNIYKEILMKQSQVAGILVVVLLFITTALTALSTPDSTNGNELEDNIISDSVGDSADSLFVTETHITTLLTKSMPGFTLSDIVKVIGEINNSGSEMGRRRTSNKEGELTFYYGTFTAASVFYETPEGHVTLELNLASLKIRNVDELIKETDNFIISQYEAGKPVRGVKYMRVDGLWRKYQQNF